MGTKENRIALKSGAWYTVSNFLVKAIGFITTPIFTRLMTKAEFGLFNNFTSVLSIATIIVTLNLESTLISARYDYEDRFDEYILSSLALSFLSVSIWIAIVNIAPAFFVDLLGVDKVYLNAMLVYLVASPSVHLFQARERFLFEYKKTVAMSLFISISTAALSVLLVTIMNDRLAGRIIGFITPTVIVGVFLYAFFIKYGKRVRIDYWKYALPICLPYIPHLLSLTVLNSVDRIMITKICGAEQNALYSIGYSVGMIVTLLLTSVNSAYAPWLGNKLAVDSYEEIRAFSKKYVGMFMFLAGGIMLLAPEVLYVLGGKPYIEAMYIIPPIAMGCACQFVYTMFVNVEQFKKKTGGMAVASISAALLNIFLNYIFIPKYGYVAAAYTTLAGYTWLVVSHMYLVYKLGYKKVYDYKYIIMALATMFLVSIGITKVYYLPVLRYSIITVYAVSFIVIAYNKREEIKAFLGR